jgi:thiamine pyrophosphokinase
MKAIIICNGSINNYNYYNKYLKGAGLIICVDGGAAHARKFGIIPHVLLGDFDSILPDDFRFFEEAGSEIFRFPVEKDMTDTDLAVKLAFEKRYNEIVFIGGLGTRIDHSLANVFMLRKILDMGIRASIVDEQNEIYIIKDHIKFTKEENMKVTLLPVSDRVEGVNTKGLYYRLEDATLEMGSTWGVSNEFAADIAEVSIESGYLLVIKSRD